MAFDNSVFHAAAEKNDVARVAICAQIAIVSLKFAVENLAKKTGIDVKDDMKEVDNQLVILGNLFDSLSGYIPE